MCLWTQRPRIIANSNGDQAGSQGHISLITVERSCPKMLFLKYENSDIYHLAVMTNAN